MMIIQIKVFNLVVGWGAQSEKAAGQGYSSARRGVGREFSSIILISNTLDHPYRYKSGSPLLLQIFIKILAKLNANSDYM